MRYSAQSSRAAIPWQGGRYGCRYALIVYLKCGCLLVAPPQNITADRLKGDIIPFLSFSCIYIYLLYRTYIINIYVYIESERTTEWIKESHIRIFLIFSFALSMQMCFQSACYAVLFVHQIYRDWNRGENVVARYIDNGNTHKRPHYPTWLYYIILYYIILYYIILYYIILYYIILYYIILYYIILYYIILYYIILYYIILYYIKLNYIKLYYVILYYIILYFIITTIPWIMFKISWRESYDPFALGIHVFAVFRYRSRV